MTVDPLSLRAFGHDLRGLLAAAATNAEYLRSLKGIPPEALEVIVEIEHEVRLAATAMELYSTPHESTRVTEIDVRAFFWLARRRGGRIVVDATTAPFIVRGPLGRLEQLVADVLELVREGADSMLGGNADVLVIGSVDPQRAAALSLEGLPLVKTVEQNVLRLHRA